ncbi:P-loop containing nucleoside triphosphate hydrolase protein [Paxillus ammoniavirescens]|nr:P-loop containing nucleoside triphosphate hydrolase protein [Paxillus ammoniavirescens]
MSLTVSQNLFIGDFPPIAVSQCVEEALSAQLLQPLSDTVIGGVIGVSATFRERCQLSSIAFATLSRVLVVHVPKSNVPRPKDRAKQLQVSRGRALLQEHILLSPKFQKHAFRMDQIATALYSDLSLCIDDGVDMLSVTTHDRRSLQALMDSMGGETTLHRVNVKALFFSREGDTGSGVALRAWAACRAAMVPEMSRRFSSISRINTNALPKAHLTVLAKLFRDGERLDAMKPTHVRNEVQSEFTVKKGAVNLTCSRFPTRIRPSSNQVIQLEMRGSKTTTNVTGRVNGVSGRNARVVVNSPIQGDEILSVTSIGKEPPTWAETFREDIIRKALQNATTLLSQPFFKSVWLPGELPLWPVPKAQRTKPLVYFPGRALNISQEEAVGNILSTSNEDRVVMIQGPPGTGKTTVIAAAVISHDYANSNRTIWIAAQSNVAVKNIAEKLIKEGFDKFKLLVSKDFHFDWHEHLYEKLQARLIRSDIFKMSVVEASRLLLDSKVILCTLSMFSNPNIDVFLRIVPVEMVIFDEASQIESGDYLPMLHRFRSTLSKLVFIGDDKQLPPYGQEDIPELRSVFEFPHLRKRALFLDTQYRMPHIFGRFVSQKVYNGKLITCHNITNSSACRFIDVKKGQEVKMGHSWTPW